MAALVAGDGRAARQPGSMGDNVAHGLLAGLGLAARQPGSIGDGVLTHRAGWDGDLMATTPAGAEVDGEEANRVCVYLGGGTGIL